MQSGVDQVLHRADRVISNVRHVTGRQREDEVGDSDDETAIEHKISHRQKKKSLGFRRLGDTVRGLTPTVEHLDGSLDSEIDERLNKATEEEDDADSDDDVIDDDTEEVALLRL